ncbi:MAG: hypothetical protein LLG14_06710 [Nocardiaceae bacterium]|nr:hypothetical protein [Nocardiaceae bacterium]
MTEVVDLQAELVKLGRTLQCDPSDLQFLAPVGWPAIREFRLVLTDVIAEYTHERFAHLEPLANIIPIPLIAKLGPAYFAPEMCAAFVSLLGEQKSLKIIGKLSPEFIADVAPYSDPRVIGPLIAKVDFATTKKVLPLLIEREEYITLGQFIDFVTPDLLESIMPIVPDEALIRVAEVAENKTQYDELIPLVTDERLGRLIQTANEKDLWSIALDMLNEVNPENRARLANISAQQSDGLLESLVTAVHVQNQFDLFVPMTAAISEENLERIANLRIMRRDDVMAAIAESAVRTDQWSTLSSLIPLLPEESLRALAASPTLRDASTARIVISDAVGGHNLIPNVLPLVNLVTDEVRQLIADEISALSPEALDELARDVLERKQWANLLPLVALMTPEARAHFTSATAGFDRDSLMSAMVSANDHGRFSEMLSIASAMPAAARRLAVEIISDSVYEEDFLGTALDAASQQAVWRQVLKLADNLPAPVLKGLADGASLLNLDGVYHAILSSAESPEDWKTGFAILSGIHDRATEDGVPVEVTVQGKLIQAAVEQIAESKALQNFSFAHALLEGALTNEGVAHGFDNAAIKLTTTARESAAVLAEAMNEAREKALGLLGRAKQILNQPAKPKATDPDE